MMYEQRYQVYSLVQAQPISRPVYYRPSVVIRYAQPEYVLMQNSMQTIHNAFLEEKRPLTQFIDCDWQVQELLNETLSAMELSLPDNVIVHICDNEKMQRIMGSHTESIRGFAIGPEVFVHKDNLDMVMVVLGHELGHIWAPPLKDPVLEEAKAFAFQSAWVSAIRENDIGGLRDNIKDVEPAQNGLHDRAYAYVLNKMRQGIAAFDVFRMLTHGQMLSIDNYLE